MSWLTTRNLYNALSTSTMSSTTSNHTGRHPSSSRRILVNRIQQMHKFCSNEISTCKYNAFTFLPRFLLEQFRRYSNVFFLVIALLQQIPEVSPTGRYTTAVPFLIILSVSALKEIFEDLVKVGEIVKIEEGHTFPADLVLISSSELEGMAYIETSSLDGETNLKIRQALHQTAGFVHLNHLNALNGMEIECEGPSRHVSEFTGTMSLNGEQMPLRINQLLLRGAKLKNTKWIYGVVVYTGHDARLLMNSRTAPLKRSNIDAMTNQRILFLFFTLITLALISAIGAEIYNKFLLVEAEYIGKIVKMNFAWNALTFFILYNNLIPISLQVTLEVVRFFQAGYINADILMYDENTDTPANARTSNLNEELGQVKFLMTDKTGTLTCNVMKFKCCTIGGLSYGNDEDEEFSDEALLCHMKEANGRNSQRIRDFLLVMSVCHTVVPEFVKNNETNEDEIRYQASSPDEGALVRGASSQGYVFYARRPKEIVVKSDEGNITLQLLNVLEFNSDRKRMSVIIRDPDGNIKLYCKGADNVIFDRLSQEEADSEQKRVAEEHLQTYACKGYRTLCFASASIHPQFYEEWAERFRKASISLEDREQKLADVAEEIEKEFKLIGASAIEDKLQDYVPDTIRALLEADIRIWMLTGDKRETAINIAQSSALCTKITRLLTLDKRTYDEVLNDLNEFVEKSKQYLKDGTEFALVINGVALHHAISGEARRVFTELAFNCHSVVCCRMTPMQKAEIVEIVRECTQQIVLAVGDGANDVAMIQAANVGIGITGEEGLQAASASDYSIGQFHFLRRLLLVHGTWNFDRSVKVILYSFYKNICLYIIELWFAFFSAFSGQTIFERWTIATFNVIFTAWPPIILGLFDRPISERQILKNPALYTSFQQSAFSNKKFALWIGMSLWHSLLLFFLSYGFLKSEVVWSSGRVGGWLMLGNTAYTFVVTTVSLKALLECDSWTWVIVISCFGSILLWFMFLAIYSWIWPLVPLGAEISGMAWIMFSSEIFWLAFVLIPLTTLLLDFILKGICTIVVPSPREQLCMAERVQRSPSGRIEAIERNSSGGIVNEFGFRQDAINSDETLRLGTRALLNGTYSNQKNAFAPSTTINRTTISTPHTNSSTIIPHNFLINDGDLNELTTPTGGLVMYGSTSSEARNKNNNDCYELIRKNQPQIGDLMHKKGV